MNTRAKMVNLLLYDGSLQGVIGIEDSTWDSGAMYLASRDSLEQMLAIDACNRNGVFLLFSSSRIYVGQSPNVSLRKHQRIVEKDWWDRLVFLTTNDDSLSNTDINYLESVLKNKALSVGKLEGADKKKFMPPKIDTARKVFLYQYLEEALFLMQLMGIDAFLGKESEQNQEPPSKSLSDYDAMDIRSRLSFGKRVKGEALAYVRENGVEPGKHTSYSVLQSNGETFWINPRIQMLSCNWYMILNDTSAHELIVLRVPKETIALKHGSSKGLITRSDKPDLIDLVISKKTLIDKRSGVNFSPYLVRRIAY